MTRARHTIAIVATAFLFHGWASDNPMAPAEPMATAPNGDAAPEMPSAVEFGEVGEVSRIWC
jgi:hypothetical protein